jgi:hypothetical protein
MVASMQLLILAALVGVVAVQRVYMRGLDEVAWVAKKQAWYWGGSTAMLIAWLLIPVFTPLLSGVADWLASWESKTEMTPYQTGALYIVVAQVIGSTIWWAIWWVRKR